MLDKSGILFHLFQCYFFTFNQFFWYVSNWSLAFAFMWKSNSSINFSLWQNIQVWSSWYELDLCLFWYNQIKKSSTVRIYCQWLIVGQWLKFMINQLIEFKFSKLNPKLQDPKKKKVNKNHCLQRHRLDLYQGIMMRRTKTYLRLDLRWLDLCQSIRMHRTMYY